MNTAADFFKYTMVINLDERTDRWTHIQKQFERLGLNSPERLSACRYTLDQLPPIQHLDRLRAFLKRVDGDHPLFDRKLAATYGCSQSHMLVLKRAKEERWPWVLILEDDIEFEPYTMAVLRRACLEIKHQPWKMLYLGGTFKKGGEKQRFLTHWDKMNRIRLTHAYIVRESLYDSILSEAPKSGLPLDWYYSEVLQKTTSCLRVHPVLAYQRLNDVSSIESVARKREFKSRKMLKKLWYRMRYFGG